MLAEIFQNPKPIVATLPLLPLPGRVNRDNTSGWQGDMETLVDRAVQEANVLVSGGVDGLLIENSLDAAQPQDRLDPAAAMAMTVVVQRIQQWVHVPIGLTVYPNDPETAVAMAMAVGARFIRMPLPVGMMYQESGLVEGRLPQLVQAREALKIPASLQVIADLSVTHLYQTTAVGEETDPVTYLHKLIQVVSQYNAVDGFVISGEELTLAQAQTLRSIVSSPLLLNYMGSDFASVPEYHRILDGLLLGGGAEKKQAISGQSGAQELSGLDMVKVEAMVSQLKEIESVSEMDPNFFLEKMYEEQKTTL